MPRIWLVAAMMLAAGVNEARAWGAAGHSIVAELAERRLKPKALSEMTKLLGGRKSLASISTWADEVQMLRPATRNWHFVNIPFDASDYVVDRDCTQKPGGDCVVRAIERMRAVLADRSKPRLERAEALMFLVHFIGDVHQPMHCVDRNDAGGGQLAVTFFGQSTNLHLVWDVGLIERRTHSWGEYVRDRLGQRGSPCRRFRRLCRAAGGQPRRGLCRQRAAHRRPTAGTCGLQAGADLE